MYTHRFRIQINGFTLRGEIAFNDGEPHFHFTDTPDMKVEELRIFTDLFRQFIKISCTCGNIGSIEIREIEE